MLISKFRHAILSQNYLNSIHNVYILNRKLSGISNDKIEVNEMTTETTADVTKYYLPEPPMDPELLPKFLDLNHLGEPTFKSLGLNSYWPSGWVQHLFEIMHVDIGLSWWSTIVASGIAIRVVMSPISYKIKQLTIVNSYISPKIQDLQKKVHSAQIAYDSIAIAKLMQDQRKLMANSGFSPIKSAIYSILQIPVFVSIMIGLKKMAELPVPSLQTGGLFWFTDLTMYDPYYILPVSTMILLYFQLEVGADIKKNTNSGYLKWGIRSLPIIALIFTCRLPSALLLYWWTSSCMSLMFSGIMSIPFVKTRLGLSTLKYQTKTVSDSKLGYYQSFKESHAEKRIIKLAKQYQDIEHDNWVKAGTSSIPKTYKYDPTKVNPTQSN